MTHENLKVGDRVTILNSVYSINEGTLGTVSAVPEIRRDDELNLTDIIPDTAEDKEALAFFDDEFEVAA